MDVALEHLQLITRTDDEAQLLEYLNFVSECKVISLNKSKGEDISSFINSLLCSKKYSKEGLLILAKFIEQCPKEILSTNILSWVQQAVKNLVNPENGSLCSVAFSVLGIFIKISSSFPEARKQIALSSVPKILDHLVRESKGLDEDLIILSCLEEILKVYGRSCVFHKGPILKIIFSHLSSSPSCVFLAGKCYLSLATCGGPGTDGQNYITAWQNQQKFLLNSLHNLLDHLFQNISEVHDNHKKYRLEENQPVIPFISEKSLVKRKQLLANQFRGLAEFFKILLLGSFPFKKRIFPESILALVWRGLSINSYTLSVGQQSVDKSSLITVISKVNVACLEILEALIASCSMNLISYSQLICKVLSQALKWTEVENWPFGITKPNSTLRVKIYRCLRKWLHASRACSGIDKYLDDHISAIINDISYDPPIVALKVPTGKGKRKLKDMKTSKSELSLEYLCDQEMNFLTCEAALNYVSAVLNTLSTLMSSNHHKVLQEAVVRKLISVQNLKFSIPYTKKSQCRLALYEVLLSLCQNCHHTFPPPVSYATAIFSAGIKDTSLEVSNFCLFSLRSLEKTLRPICTTLCFPPSKEGIVGINISTGIDESYLLNESKRQKMTKRKRSSQQVTSTPVNNNHVPSKLITPGIETPLTIGKVQNLSDFEKGAHFSPDKDASVITDLSESLCEIVDNQTEHAIATRSHKLMAENKLSVEEKSSVIKRTNHSATMETSDDPTEIGESSSSFSEKNINNKLPEDTLLMECKQNGTPELLEPYSSPKVTIPLNLDEEIPTEDKSELIKTIESDDEMMNSFVDEVIEDS